MHLIYKVFLNYIIIFVLVIQFYFNIKLVPGVLYQITLKKLTVETFSTKDLY